DLARIDLDRVVAGVVLPQPEGAPERAHERTHLVVRDEGRRAAAPVQLLDRTLPAEQFRLQLDLAVQRFEVGRGAAAILRDDLVARSVEADRGAERQVHVERERRALPFGAAAPRRRAILGLAERLMELL